MTKPGADLGLGPEAWLQTPLAHSAVLDSYESGSPRRDQGVDRFQRDLIACGDEMLMESALILGQGLRRPVVKASISADWLRTVGDPASVLLFARRESFSSGLTREWVGEALQRDIPLGFVLADDAADAGFQARKILLAHTQALDHDDAVVDAVNGFCGSPDELEVARPERLTAVLAGQWRVLAIGGHSDLGHMSLGSHVVCGAHGPEQVGGVLLKDGCDPRAGRCRRRLGFQRIAVPADSLRAAVVALLGCNSFDLATREYASSSSLCASALSGSPAAVIATLGKLDSDFDAAGEFARAMIEGLSLGAAVLRLNRAHQIPTGYGIALAGDPALSFRPRLRAAVTGLSADMAPGRPAPAEAADCRERAQPLIDRCTDLIGRARAARRLHRAMVKISDSSLEVGLEDALNLLGRRCEQVEDAAWEGIRLMHQAIDYRHWQEPDWIPARLDRAVGRWDVALVEAASRVSGNDMYTALHQFHRLDTTADEGVCQRCGSRGQVFGYGDPELASMRRIAAECWMCGPVAECADGDLRLSITAAGLHRPGALVRPRLRADEAVNRQARSGRLAVVLNDRPQDTVLAAHQASGSLADLLEFSIAIPADARSDLHVLWAVWVSELTVSFAATRLAVAREH